MFKLSKNFEYALIAIKHMAAKKADEMTSVREISEQYGLSFNLLARILLILKNASIVGSIQGTKGGYVLSADLNNLRMSELIKIVSEENLMLTDCLSKDIEKKRRCKIKKSDCNIYADVKNLQSKVEHFLDGITMKEFMAG